MIARIPIGGPETVADLRPRECQVVAGEMLRCWDRARAPLPGRPLDSWRSGSRRDAVSPIRRSFGESTDAADANSDPTPAIATIPLTASHTLLLFRARLARLADLNLVDYLCASRLHAISAPDGSIAPLPSSM